MITNLGSPMTIFTSHLFPKKKWRLLNDIFFKEDMTMKSVPSQSLKKKDTRSISIDPMNPMPYLIGESIEYKQEACQKLLQQST